MSIADGQVAEYRSAADGFLGYVVPPPAAAPPAYVPPRVWWSLSLSPDAIPANPTPFDTVVQDTGGIIDEVAAGTDMTITNTGVYAVDVFITNADPGAASWAWLVIDGSEFASLFGRWNSSAVPNTNTLRVVVQLQAGQVLGVKSNISVSYIAIAVSPY